MSFVTEKPIKAVRKARPCEACATMVNAGEAAISWAGNYDGDFTAVIYHPDCRAAEIAYNAMVANHWEDWAALTDMEEEDNAWLLAEHPSVAARLGIPTPPPKALIVEGSK